MKKNLLFFLLIVIFLYFIFMASLYLFSQRSYQNNLDKLSYKQAFEILLPKLLIYEAKVDSKKINLIMHDKSARVLPQQAVEKSDLLIGYGVLNDTELEGSYTYYYNKPTFLYDCSQDPSVMKEHCAKCNFEPECIGTDKYVLEGLSSTAKLHTFGEKIKELGVEDKKIFLKMDIAGAEKEVLPEILQHSDKLTGMLITFHFTDVQTIIELSKIFDQINEKFILVSRNTLYNHEVMFLSKLKSILYDFELSHYTLALSFVNKNLVTNDRILFNQNTNFLYKDVVQILNQDNLEVYEHGEYEPLPNNNINVIVPIVEKIKNRWKQQ